MGKKEPAWKSYTGPVTHHIPRLTEGEELEHRAKLLCLRDWSQGQRHKANWHDDQLLQSIGSIVTPYALSTTMRSDQVATLLDAMNDLVSAIGKLRAAGLP